MKYAVCFWLEKHLVFLSPLLGVVSLIFKFEISQEHESSNADIV